jgi:hypothetical protein
LFICTTIQWSFIIMLTVGQAHKGLSFITAPIREP